MRLAFLLAAILAGCSVQPAGNATPRTAPDLPAQSGAPPVASSPAQLERLRVSTVGSGVGVRVESVPTDHLSGAPLTPEVLAGTAIMAGRASWYAASGDVASVPWWRFGMEPRWAAVSRVADGRTYSVTVLIVGFCQCLVGTDSERLIDLSDGAFRQLAPLSVGLIRVTVELTDAGPGLPATDLEGEP